MDARAIMQSTIIAVAFFAAVLWVSDDVAATHYFGGNLEVSQNPLVDGVVMSIGLEGEVKVTGKQLWRASWFPNAAPCMLVTSSDLLTFSDGSQQTFQWLILSVDTTNDLAVTQMVAANAGTAACANPDDPTFHVSHIFQNSGGVESVFWESCCRLSNGAGGSDHVNNPNSFHKTLATILVDGQADTPIFPAPQLVKCIEDSICKFSMAAQNRGQGTVSYRLATSAEASRYGQFYQPGPDCMRCPAGLDELEIDSTTGEITWDTTDANIAPGGQGQRGTLYSVHIIAESAEGSVPLEFLIEVTSIPGFCPPGSWPSVDPNTGQWICVSAPSAAFDYQFNQVGVQLHDESTGSAQIVAWHWEFPDGSTSNEQNPFKEMRPGSHEVKLTVTDSNGLESSTKQTVRAGAPEILGGGLDVVKAGYVTGVNPTHRYQIQGYWAIPVDQFDRWLPSSMQGCYNAGATVDWGDGSLSTPHFAATGRTGNVQFIITLAENCVGVLEHHYLNDGKHTITMYGCCGEDESQNIGGKLLRLRANVWGQENTAPTTVFWSYQNLVEIDCSGENPFCQSTINLTDREGDPVTLVVENNCFWSNCPSDPMYGSAQWTPRIVDGDVFSWTLDGMEAGVYHVAIRASDGKDESMMLVRVIVDRDWPRNEPPTVDVEFDEPIYLNEPHQFYAHGTDPEGGELTYRWLSSAGQSFDQNPVLTFTRLGFAYASVYVQDDRGQYASKFVSLQVVASPPTAAISVSSTTVETGESVTFTSVGDDGSGVDSYDWDFGDGVATGQSVTYSFADDGVYTVRLTVSGPGGSDSATVEIVVLNRGPSADFSWTGNGNKVQFTDASTDTDGAIVSWSWDFGDGETSTDQNPLHKFKKGSWSVTLTVTDDDGAVSVASYAVVTPLTKS